MRELTHFSLFSGIGGIDLAAEWAEFTTVGQCEIDEYAAKVLEKNFPNIERWRDIRDVTAESFRERTGIRTDELTLLSGGFPCQPHSLAGKRKGSADGRDLWGEFARVIREFNPRWVLGENVLGLLTSENGRFFGRILRDLDEMGYNVGWCCYGACEVGALHRRERVFIIANADGERELQPQRRGKKIGRRADNCSKEIVSDSDNGSGAVRRDGELSAVEETERGRGNHGRRTPEYFAGEWRDFEPNVGRLAHGISNRVDRLKCLGNAVVPQQVYPILQSIAEIETDIFAETKRRGNAQ